MRRDFRLNVLSPGYRENSDGWSFDGKDCLTASIHSFLSASYLCGYKDYWDRLIQSIPISEQLELIALISKKLSNRTAAEKNRRSLLELEGLGAEIWQGVDVQKYIRYYNHERLHTTLGDLTPVAYEKRNLKVSNFRGQVLSLNNGAANDDLLPFAVY